MSRKKPSTILKNTIIALLFFFFSSTSVKSEADLTLKIISSSDPESNQVKSFIHVENNLGIMQGVKKTSPASLLKLQIPFVIDLPIKLETGSVVKWVITTNKKSIGEIEVLSKHHFTKNKLKKGFQWESQFLNNTIEDYSRLVFRPKPLKHQQPIYKKGRGGNGKRQRYGGGTPKIDAQQFNPRLSYQIIARVEKQSGETLSYKGKVEMDNKDMIRQEYINHYKINRYGRGGYGDLPVPLREELTVIPKMPDQLLGYGLSESRYGLMVDDGLTDLAISIVEIYEDEKSKYKLSKLKFLDMKKRPLSIPKSKLWLSGGWRNPERNEWYSNALNGIHQRGGAIDIVASEPHSDKRSAIVYWFLWKALNKSKLNAFWQLETRGRPMVTREFKEDIEPKNGIPDAFDKADHMHINIKYEKYE